MLNAPGKAKEMAPTAYSAFWNYIGEKDEALKSLLDVQALIQGGNDELFKQRDADLRGMFEKGEQMFRARQLRYEKEKKSLWFHVKNIFWDKNTSVLKGRADVAKTKKIDPNIDPKYILEKNDYVASVVRSFIEKLDPVFKEVIGSKLTRDVDIYMYAKRVLGDRAEIANPLGHTPKTANDHLEFMKRVDPAKYAKIEDIVKTIQDWFRGEVNPIMKDLYTPDQITMAANNDSYAPFRVIQYMKDYVASGIISQAGTLGEVSSPFTALVMKATSMVSAAARNDIKLKIVKFMEDNPAQFPMRKAKITKYPGVFHVGEYGPYIQSERLDIYKKYAQELLDKGQAYYCFCTPERLEKMREEQK